MDDRKFRHSKNIEVRPPGSPDDKDTPEQKLRTQFETQKWIDEGSKTPDSKLAQQLGVNDLHNSDIVQTSDTGGVPVSAVQPLMSRPGNAGAVRDAIVKAAREAGENPAYALAVAERESNFKPDARSSKTIRGIYQMRGDLRAKYGVGDSSDPYDQAKGWTASLPDIRSTMRAKLGRDPTDQEAYLGHHYGAARAARTLQMDPSTPVGAVFTPQEMGANPHFARAGTIGKLNESVMGDVGKRMARFGGEGADAPPAEPADLSSMGTLVESPGLAPSMPQAQDLSSFGEPVDAGVRPAATAQQAQPAAELPDLSSFGTAV